MASMYAEESILNKDHAEDELYDLALIYLESKKELGEYDHAAAFFQDEKLSLPVELNVIARPYLFNQNIKNSDFEMRYMKYLSLIKKDSLDHQDYKNLHNPKRIQSLDSNDGKKKPWLAAIMSGIIPGSGQVYNGNFQSAADSFIFNSLLLFTTVEFYNKGYDWPAATSGLLFSMTYAGNIISSGRDAQQINRNMNTLRNQELKSQFLPELSFRIEF
jgi:hypothetical protein